MITNTDIKKMKAVFATKKELRSVDLKMDADFVQIISFIGEMKEEVMGVLSKQLEELKDITRRHQMTLEKHDSRITHLEYINKQ